MMSSQCQVQDQTINPSHPHRSQFIVPVKHPVIRRVLQTTIYATVWLAGHALAEDTRTMTVLGSVEGAVDGTTRSWLTIAGNVEGKAMSSAAWQPDNTSHAIEAALAGMSDRQRQQMKERMAHMFGNGGEDKVKLRIMGIDPNADNILRQGGLTIELPAFSPHKTESLLNAPQEADIFYHKNFGTETGFFASSHEVGTDATVTFDRLEIVSGGGYAEGSFEATICPIQSLMQGNASPEVCMLVTGRFDTELGEEPASQIESRPGR